MGGVPSLGGGIFPFPALVVDFLPISLLPFSSLWYFRETPELNHSLAYDLNLLTNIRSV